MTTIEHFSRLVYEIYEAAVEPGKWAVALDDISSTVNATGCALLITDHAQNQISVKSVGADPASMAAYNDYYGRLDPSPSALQCKPIGMVLPREQLHDRDLFTRSEFFHDWAKPNDYGDGAYAVLTRDRDGTAWLCAAAKAKPEPFGTPERLSLVEALVPHLQQAIKVGTRLSELDGRYRDFVAALDFLSDGIAIVRRDGRVIHLNPAAEAIVACRDGLCVHAGHLTATVAHTNSQLSHIVDQALGGKHSDVAAGGCVAIPRSFGQRPYVVRAIPMGANDSLAVSPPTAVIVIVDPEQEPVPDLETLRRLYGLTKTEAEVALRVLDGTGLLPIAEELSISISTVRTHLKHVFNKTDTHRQAELVRLLLRGLAATHAQGRPSR
jgi:DNA-binding CsgD family transcriptional regulator/PAS domain-containing protein